MAQQTINVGTSANSGGGDPLRNALIKVNENFTEVYADIAALKDGNVISDINGNVFAEDSTLLVDAINAKVVGPVDAPTVTSASYVDASSVNANVYGAKTVGSFINFGVNASVVNMTAAIDMQNYSIGNVGTITASQYTGDLTGSVFADDSTLLVDGVNGKIVGNIETTVATITSGLTLQNIYAQNAFGVNITANGFNNLVVTQSAVTIQNVALNPTAGITGYISIADLQTLVAASTDFGDFQTRIAAL